jgi:hypothetical protein
VDTTQGNYKVPCSRVCLGISVTAGSVNADSEETEANVKIEKGGLHGAGEESGRRVAEAGRATSLPVPAPLPDPDASGGQDGGERATTRLQRGWSSGMSEGKKPAYAY